MKQQLYLTEIVEEIVVAAAEHMHVTVNLLFLMIEYLKEKITRLWVNILAFTINLAVKSDTQNYKKCQPYETYNFILYLFYVRSYVCLIICKVSGV